MTTNFGLLTFPAPGLAGAMAKGVEDAGWDSLWLADTQNLAAEVFVSLGMAAASTTTLGLATGVTNPITRHPAVTASAIASVQAASGGRAVLGLAHPDIQMARSLVRGSTATFAHFSGMDGAPAVADESKAATFAALGRDYDMANHAKASSAQGTSLSDAFIDSFAIAGPVPHCIDRLAELIELGLDRIVMVPGSRDADMIELLGSIGRLAAEVIPQLR